VGHTGIGSLAADTSEVTYEPHPEAEVEFLESVGFYESRVESLPRFLVYALVTRDYLGTRFAEFETRVEANMGRRFVQVEAKIDKLSDALELRFERTDSKIPRIYLMFGLTMATATIPILQNFFGG
jgi:hypothetical protein